MQRLRIVLYIIIGGLLVNSPAYALQQPSVKININTAKTVTAGVIRLQLSVKAGKSTIVSWELCDELFKQSQQVILLATNSPAAADGYFKHNIVFTAAKPIQLSINALPVLINKQKFFTRAFKVSFKSARLPLKLHDIKPVEPISWFYPAKALGITLVLLTIILMFITAAYLFLKKRINTTAPIVMRQNCLNRLSAIELAAKRQRITTATLVSEVSDLLKEYLQDDILISNQYFEVNIPGQSIIQFYKFRETANRMRFLPQPAARLLYPAFLNDIREFINSYQPAILK
jgi:hypothetical protein